MTLTEQKEIDTFLEEALATGCIRESKSPLGAPVFFIKKKDSELCFALPHHQRHHEEELILSGDTGSDSYSLLDLHVCLE
jgi:hypothetical protein